MALAAAACLVARGAPWWSVRIGSDEIPTVPVGGGLAWPGTVCLIAGVCLLFGAVVEVTTTLPGGPPAWVGRGALGIGSLVGIAAALSLILPHQILGLSRDVAAIGPAIGPFLALAGAGCAIVAGRGIIRSCA